jgi:hypothetical protein
MLVDGKFFFISLPRCASTSFMISCLKQGIKLEHFNSRWDIENQHQVDLEKMTNEEIADNLTHGHESIIILEEKFGKGYDIISIKRDKYEQFISLWKHILDEIHRVGDIDSYNIFKELTEEDILFYTSNKINSTEDVAETFYNFMKRLNIKSWHPYTEIAIKILYPPLSHYHEHYDNIIWFDIKNLNELEKWVSNKLGKPFKLEKINSSQHFECGLKNTENFRKKYDSIYEKFADYKKTKTLL